MKFTIVGHWGGYPPKDGATSAYVLEKDDFVLVIDLGSGALARMQHHYELMDIDAVILSHYHHDHMADIGVLQYAKISHFYGQGNDKILPIYGHQEDEEGFAKLTDDFTKGIAYQPNETLKIGPFEIEFLKTVHPVACYGMRVTDGEKSIVYTADTAYQDAWIPFSRDADLLITDCNFYQGQNAARAGHMTSDQGAKIAAGANVKQLVLSHLPQFGDLQQLKNEASQIYHGKITLASEQSVYQI